MDKFISQFQGLIVFLLVQAVAIGMALVKSAQRLSLVEADMKDAQEEIKECKHQLAQLRDNFSSIQVEARLTEERLKHISEMAKEVQQVMQKTMEMRFKQ